MSTAADRPVQQTKELSPENQKPLEFPNVRWATEAFPHPAEAAAHQQASQADTKNNHSEAAQKELPKFTLSSSEVSMALPWAQPDNGDGHKLHMSYDMQKAAKVHDREGSYQVAERLLGKGAQSADLNALNNAMRAQFAHDHPQVTDLDGYMDCRALVDETNIASIINRIGDQDSRHRIEDKLKEGWTDEPAPVAVPFAHDARPGETMPSYIADADRFCRDLAAAAIDAHTVVLWSQGLCAGGARLAINELPQWNIDGGSVDRSILKDPRGWRSGLKMAEDLSSTGLFDRVPLSQIGVNGLKEGYIVGRYSVRPNPNWGEDYGDIDIVTRIHRPAPDSPNMYKNSFVLIPKKPNS